jgi:chromosome segregation ATPase
MWLDNSEFSHSLRSIISLASLANEQAKTKKAEVALSHKIELQNLQRETQKMKTQAMQYLQGMENASKQREASLQAEITAVREQLDSSTKQNEKFESNLKRNEEERALVTASQQQLEAQLKIAELEKLSLKEAIVTAEKEKDGYMSSCLRLEVENKLASEKLSNVERQYQQFLGNDLATCNKDKLEQLIQLHKKSLPRIEDALAMVSQSLSCLLNCDRSVRTAKMPSYAWCVWAIAKLMWHFLVLTKLFATTVPPQKSSQTVQCAGKTSKGW